VSFVMSVKGERSPGFCSSAVAVPMMFSLPASAQCIRPRAGQRSRIIVGYSIPGPYGGSGSTEGIGRIGGPSHGSLGSVLAVGSIFEAPLLS